MVLSGTTSGEVAARSGGSRAHTTQPAARSIGLKDGKNGNGFNRYNACSSAQPCLINRGEYATKHPMNLIQWQLVLCCDLKGFLIPVRNAIQQRS
jgi:hypothetical protein